MTPSKRDVVVGYFGCFRFRLFDAKIEQNSRRLIEEFIPVHEDDVAALVGIKVLYEKSPRASGYLPRRY
jgi:hypothetical protein